MAKRGDSNFTPKKSTPNALMDEISQALRRLEEQRRDKPGHTVKKIAKQLRKDYTEDPHFEMQIDLELRRMAQTGAVVKNNLSKEAWRTADSKLIVQNRGQKNALSLARQASHDSGHRLCEEQPSAVGLNFYNELPSTSRQTFSRDLGSLSDTPDEDDDVGEGRNESNTARATASKSSATASTSRVTASKSKVTASKSRGTASKSKVTASKSRVTASKSKVTASKSRVTASKNSVTASKNSMAASKSRMTATKKPTKPSSTVVSDESLVSPEVLALQDARMSEMSAQVLNTFNKNYKVSFVDHQSEFPRCPCPRCSALNSPRLRRHTLQCDVASTLGPSQGHVASQASTSAQDHSQGHVASTLGPSQGHVASLASASAQRHSVRPEILKRAATPTPTPTPGDAEQGCTSVKCRRTNSTEDVRARETETDDDDDKEPLSEADRYIQQVCETECGDGGWCSIM